MPVGFDSDKIDVLNNGGVYSAITVGTTAVELKVGGSALANRQLITIQAKDSGVFWGYSNAVTTSSGTELFKDQTVFMPIGPNTSVWLIANGAGKNVRIGELA